MANSAGNNVKFYNDGAFTSAFSIQWNGGQTDRTEPVVADQTTSLDLTQYNIPEGMSCWARAYIYGGPNHDFGRNFNYARNNASTVEYTITGGVDTPSFDS